MKNTPRGRRWTQAAALALVLALAAFATDFRGEAQVHGAPTTPSPPGMSSQPTPNPPGLPSKSPPNAPGRSTINPPGPPGMSTTSPTNAPGLPAGG